jgi:hypothetical protein
MAGYSSRSAHRSRPEERSSRKSLRPDPWTEEETIAGEIYVQQFTFSGRWLEVRATALADRCHVRVYEDQEPITPVTYSASLYAPLARDISLRDLAEHLMEVALSDVVRGIVPLLR